MDYDYFSIHCKLIVIDLSKKIKLENPDLKQQINFIGRLTKNEGVTMFFIIEKLEETAFEFSQNAAMSFLIFTTYNNGKTKNCRFIG